MEPIVSFLIFLFFLIVILVIIVKARRKRYSSSYSKNTYRPRYNSDSYGEGYRDAVKDQDRRREECYERKEREREDDRERRRVPRDEGSRISDAFEKSGRDSADFANDFFGVGKKRRKK